MQITVSRGILQNVKILEKNLLYQIINELVNVHIDNNWKGVIPTAFRAGTDRNFLEFFGWVSKFHVPNRQELQKFGEPHGWWCTWYANKPWALLSLSELSLCNNFTEWEGVPAFKWSGTDPMQTKKLIIQWLVLLYWLLLILNYELQTRSGTVLKGLWSSEAVIVKTNTKSLHKNPVYSVECTCWMCFSFGLNVFSVLGWAHCLATFSPDPAEKLILVFFLARTCHNLEKLGMKNTILIGSTSLGWVAIANPRLSPL